MYKRQIISFAGSFPVKPIIPHIISTSILFLIFYDSITDYRTLFCSYPHIFFLYTHSACAETHPPNLSITFLLVILSFSVPSGPGAKVLTFRILCPPISHSCLILSYQYLKCKRKERADAPEHLPFLLCVLLT